jgi:hypothetical protein
LRPTTTTGILGTISTGAMVAGVLALAAGALCLASLIPGAGYLLPVGAAAIAALLVTVFFLISGAVATISEALGTLTGPLGTLSGSITAVNAILGASVPPSGVTGSLGSMSASLTSVQNALAAQGPFLDSINRAVTELQQRADALKYFQNPTPPPQPGQPPPPRIPREHLEDTRREAVRIYNNGIAAAQGPVGTAMLADPINNPQIVDSKGVVDKTLACVGVVRAT